MTDPHSDEVLSLADGRRLGWAEWGDPRGSPMLFLHPSPGSRMLCPDPARTAAAGIRLITVDRPGYGHSDPVEEPTLAGFARDVERLLDHLWVGRVRVVGWSCGGQFAAACAAVLADRVSGVALLATPAPESEVPWLSPPFREVAELADDDPRRALAAVDVLRASLAGALGEAWDSWIGPGGGDPTAQPDVKGALAAMWAEAFHAGAAGLAADVVAACSPWGFAPSEVRARVSLFYGEDDPVIGPVHGQWWVEALPRAELIVRRERGSLVPFVAWADILRAVGEAPK